MLGTGGSGTLTTRRWIDVTLLTATVALACRPSSDIPGDGAPSGAPTETACALPHAPDTLVSEGGAVLVVWQVPADEVFFGPTLPSEPAFQAYRDAVIRAGTDRREPALIVPETSTGAEAQVWADEAYNNRLVYAEGVGTIEPITCLDALLFAQQASRVSQLENPTEFLASVLERTGERGRELTVLFGAGTELFPPRAVYGFDAVDRYLDEGWQFAYALHNHTLQESDDRLVLGVPVPSTSDVSLLRGLARERGLRSVRVTNGFYTFEAPVDALADFRAR